jgi:hypothetical protein
VFLQELENILFPCLKIALKKSRNWVVVSSIGSGLEGFGDNVIDAQRKEFAAGGIGKPELSLRVFLDSERGGWGRRGGNGGRLSERPC